MVLGALVAFSAMPCSAQQDLCVTATNIQAMLRSKDGGALKGKLRSSIPDMARWFYEGLVLLPDASKCDVGEFVTPGRSGGKDWRRDYSCTFLVASRQAATAKVKQLEAALKACSPKADIAHTGGYLTNILLAPGIAIAITLDQSDGKYSVEISLGAEEFEPGP